MDKIIKKPVLDGSRGDLCLPNAQVMAHNASHGKRAGTLSSGLIASLVLLFTIHLSLFTSAEATLFTCGTKSGLTCVGSLVSFTGTTQTTIWNDEPLTEAPAPGSSGLSQYVKEYSSAFDPDESYFAYCTCTGADAPPPWWYLWGPPENRSDTPVSTRCAQASIPSPAQIWGYSGMRALTDKEGFKILDAEKTSLAQRVWDDSYTSGRRLTSRKIGNGESLAQQETLVTLGNGVNTTAQLPTQSLPTLSVFKSSERDMMFGLAMDLTGKEVWFIVKSSLTALDSTAIINKRCDVTDITAGTIGLALTTADTATVGSYYARIEIRDAGGANPRIMRKYNFKVVFTQ